MTPDLEAYAAELRWWGYKPVPMTAPDRVLFAIENGCHTIPEIAKACDYTPYQVTSPLSVLFKRGAIRRVGVGMYKAVDHA